MQLNHRMQLTCSCSHNGFAIRDGFSESDKDFFTIRWGRHIDDRIGNEASTENHMVACS